MMFVFNLKKSSVIFAVLIVCIFTISPTKAGGYTSEEIDEQSKSLYRAESSILASTENNKHQHKHTYFGSPPCASGGCPGAFNPCSNPSGCPQPNAPVFNNGHSINSGAPVPVGYTNGGYGVGHSINPGYGHVAPPPPQTSHTGVSGYAPPLPYQVPNAGYAAGNNIHSSGVNKPPTHQPSQVGYSGYTPQPAGTVPYAHWNSPPSHYGYQGPRGYSVYDHSLKLNTEYTETGTHTGPLQRGNNGYGSGYGGGYNGLFNRPGF